MESNRQYHMIEERLVWDFTRASEISQQFHRVEYFRLHNHSFLLLYLRYIVPNDNERISMRATNVILLQIFNGSTSFKHLFRIVTAWFCLSQARYSTFHWRLVCCPVRSILCQNNISSSIYHYNCVGTKSSYVKVFVKSHVTWVVCQYPVLTAGLLP